MNDTQVVSIDIPGRGVTKRFTLEPLTWFQGANGAGKTTCILGLLIAASGGEIREGLKGTEGRVSAFGVTVTIGGRSPKVDGVPEVEVLDGGAFSRLVQPPSDERPTRIRQRVKALLQLVNIKTSEEALLALCAGDQDVAAAVQAPPERKSVPAWDALDLFDLAELARTVANKIALAEEKKADELAGSLQSLTSRCDSIPFSDCNADPEDVKAQLEEQRRRTGRLEAGAQARAELEAQKASIDLGAKPDLANAELELALADDAVAKLEASLAAARERREAANQAVRRIRSEVQAWESRQAILERPLSGPTAADVKASREKEQELVKLLADAESSRDWRQLQAEITSTRDRKKALESRALWLRSVVQTMPSALAQLLSECGLSGLKIIDGELATKDGRKIEELSLGEVVKWAYPLALPAFQSSGYPVLLYLPEKPVSTWFALDTKGKLDLVDVCRNLGIVLLVETATEGELKVVHDVMQGLKALAGEA